jgi:hypothetical protein
VWGVLPGDPQISFESHLAGALAGCVLALLLRDVDPPPAQKRYSWEIEADEPDDIAWVERVDEAPEPGGDRRLPGP